MDISSSSQSLRVLHVSHAVNTGLAHCVADYVEYQVSRGLSVAVSCPSGRLADRAVAHGARHIEWDATRNPRLETWQEIRAFSEVVREAQPDVVHLHCAKAGLVGRLVLRGKIPTVFSPHAWSFLATDGVMSKLVREWERWAARWSSMTICVSHAEARTGRAHGIRGPVLVLPNQIDTRPIEPLVTRYRAEVRASLGITAGEPLAVCAARLTRQKGQGVAVAAWNRVREAVPSARLVFVGEGPDRDVLEAQAGEGVEFPGYLSAEDTLRWMFAADVILCPSRWEGMSLVPLEAAALGRPVIASDVDGMRESIEEGTGWLIQPDDVGALAEMASKVLANPEVAFDAGQLARSRFLEAQADTSSSKERLVDLYRELCL